jgi:hypothetical protein
MNRVVLALLGCVLATAALCESSLEPGAIPDPGLRDDAKPKYEREQRTGRPARPDLIDDVIVKLPRAELNFKEAGSTDETCEKLTYDIFVNRLPHARSTMELRSTEKNDKPVWRATLSTRSNRAATLFYDVRDNVVSTFDEKGGFSRFFSMDRKEGDAHVVERINFNNEKDKMEATYERPKPSLNGNNEIRWVTTTIPLTGKVLDPLSAVYFLRDRDLNLKALQPDKQKPALVLPICSDRHVFNTSFYVVGIDHPDVDGLKDRTSVVFEIDAPFKGLFERVGRVRIWVDAATGVVLRLRSETPIGPMEAVLSDHSHSPLD